MIPVIQAFPLDDNDLPAGVDYWAGLLNVSPEAADFYNRYFELDVVSGETSPIAHDETWWDERISASSMGIAATEDPREIPGGALIVDSLGHARKIFAEHNIPIVRETLSEEGPVLIIADPDRNLIAIIEIGRTT